MAVAEGHPGSSQPNREANHSLRPGCRAASLLPCPHPLNSQPFFPFIHSPLLSSVLLQNCPLHSQVPTVLAKPSNKLHTNKSSPNSLSYRVLIICLSVAQKCHGACSALLCGCTAPRKHLAEPLWGFFGFYGGRTNSKMTEDERV